MSLLFLFLFINSLLILIFSINSEYFLFLLKSNLNVVDVTDCQIGSQNRDRVHKVEMLMMFCQTYSLKRELQKTKNWNANVLIFNYYNFFRQLSFCFQNWVIGKKNHFSCPFCYCSVQSQIICNSPVSYKSLNCWLISLSF
jgi:hypothetical protein